MREAKNAVQIIQKTTRWLFCSGRRGCLGSPYVPSAVVIVHVLLENWQVSTLNWRKSSCLRLVSDVWLRASCVYLIREVEWRVAAGSVYLKCGSFSASPSEACVTRQVRVDISSIEWGATGMNVYRERRARTKACGEVNLAHRLL